MTIVEVFGQHLMSKKPLSYTKTQVIFMAGVTDGKIEKKVEMARGPAAHCKILPCWVAGAATLAILL